MLQHQIIECAKEADRRLLTSILAANGYTVKETRFKKGKSSVWTYAVEYWREK